MEERNKKIKQPETKKEKEDGRSNRSVGTKR
jgi:hypothetical protein